MYTHMAWRIFPSFSSHSFPVQILVMPTSLQSLRLLLQTKIKIQSTFSIDTFNSSHKVKELIFQLRVTKLPTFSSHSFSRKTLYAAYFYTPSYNHESHYCKQKEMQVPFSTREVFFLINLVINLIPPFASSFTFFCSQSIWSTLKKDMASQRRSCAFRGRSDSPKGNLSLFSTLTRDPNWYGSIPQAWWKPTNPDFWPGWDHIKAYAAYPNPWPGRTGRDWSVSTSHWTGVGLAYNSKQPNELPS